MWWRVTVLIGVVLVAGCARPSTRSITPLPPAVTITAPSPDVPPKIAAFSGTWVGQWRAGEVTMEHTLVVESIEKDGDAFRVQILFSHGDQPLWGYNAAGFLRTDGSIGPDGKLRLKAFPNSARIIYAMPTDEELSGELTLSGLTSYGTFLHPSP